MVAKRPDASPLLMLVRSARFHIGQVAEATDEVMRARETAKCYGSDEDWDKLVKGLEHLQSLDPPEGLADKLREASLDDVVMDGMYETDDVEMATDAAAVEWDRAAAGLSLANGPAAMLEASFRLMSVLEAEQKARSATTVALGPVGIDLAVELDQISYMVSRAATEAGDLRSKLKSRDATLSNARLIGERLPTGGFDLDNTLAGRALSSLMIVAETWPDIRARNLWIRALPGSFRRLWECYDLLPNGFICCDMSPVELYQAEAGYQLLLGVDVRLAPPKDVRQKTNSTFTLTVSIKEGLVGLREWLHGQTLLKRQMAMLAVARIVASAHSSGVILRSILWQDSTSLMIDFRTMEICVARFAGARPLRARNVPDPEALREAKCTDGKEADVYRAASMAACWCGDTVEEQMRVVINGKHAADTLVKELETSECMLCATAKKLDDFVTCSEDHSFCKECLDRGVQGSNPRTHDPMGSFRCPYSEGVALCWVTDIGRCIPQASFEAYLDLQAEVRGKATVHAALIESEAKVVKACLHEKAQENIIVRHVEDHVLPNRCPRCGQHFDNFEACSALECFACGCAFCAWCLEDCGLDAHEHVVECLKNPERNLRGALPYSAPFEKFLAVQNIRRKMAVSSLLASAPEELREAVGIRLAPRLRALNEESSAIDSDAETLPGDAHDAQTPPW